MFGNKDLQILYYMSRGKRTVPELSVCLNISVPETYRKIRGLRSRDVICGKDPIGISCCPYAKRLMALMAEGPGMAKYLSGAGLTVLASMIRPNSINDIAVKTCLSESHVRKILKLLMEGNLVQRINDLFRINDEECPKLRPFLISYNDYLEVSDPRISNDSEVLYREGADLVFSSVDGQGYRPTGITAFKEYGMKGISDNRGFYTTKQGELDMDSIFDDAVRIAEVENDWRLRMANELFYIKNKDRLVPPKSFLETHNRIMSGDRVKNWPSKNDLDDRMWMVDG